MRKKHAFSALLASALLSAAAVNSHAQAWETLLPRPDFAPGWSGHSVLIDPFSPDPANPGIFLGCWSDDPATGVGSVLRLDNNGIPSVVDTDLDRVYGLGYNPANSTLYTVGDRLRVATAPAATDNQSVWKVRKSSAGGAWVEDDTFYLSTKAYASARGITTDANGNVYVCGAANPERGNSHWIVRKLPAGGSWTTVTDVAGKSGTEAAIARGIFHFPGSVANPTKAVFAVGILNSKWTVLRSQNQGATWQIVDAWSPNKAVATADEGICDSAGNIYVVGFRGNFQAPTGWVVRKSSDGGNTWTQVLDISEGTYSAASGVAADAFGNVWVSGMTQNTSGISRWTVLKNGVFGSLSANNAAFLQARQLPFGETKSTARGMVTDNLGNVFVTGMLVDWVNGADSYSGQRVGVQRLRP